jgi:hypothetical protein
VAIYTKFQRASCSTGVTYIWCEFHKILRFKVVTSPLLEQGKKINFSSMKD